MTVHRWLKCRFHRRASIPQRKIPQVMSNPVAQRRRDAEFKLEQHLQEGRRKIAPHDGPAEAISRADAGGPAGNAGPAGCGNPRTDRTSGGGPSNTVLQNEILQNDQSETVPLGQDPNPEVTAGPDP
jgi:hypothetical protein